MANPKKQISLFVDRHTWLLLRQRAATLRVPLTQLVLSAINWPKILGSVAVPDEVP